MSTPRQSRVSGSTGPPHSRPTPTCTAPTPAPPRSLPQGIRGRGPPQRARARRRPGTRHPPPCPAGSAGDRTGHHPRHRRFFDRALIEHLAAGFKLIDVSDFTEGELPSRLARVSMRVPQSSLCPACHPSAATVDPRERASLSWGPGGPAARGLRAPIGESSRRYDALGSEVMRWIEKSCATR
jgi:hypothetical protein